MALNKAVFKTRAITAVVFAAVMLCGLFINGYTFIALCGVIAVGCAFEVVKIIRKIWPDKWFVYLLPSLFYAVVPIFLFFALGFMWIVNNDFVGSYLALLPVFIIASIWINDTMAYIVGSMIGKTPFSKISPKKTWEGTAGGAILCVVVMTILGSTIPFFKTLSIKDCICISAICAVAGTLGDLFESKLKRMAGVKDSGTFMPGHGGFLDRFDSLLFAVPCVWVYLYFGV